MYDFAPNSLQITKENVSQFLCTGAFLYAPYSLLLISNKFWMGRGRVGNWWGRGEGAELEGENKRGGAGRLSYFMHLLPHPLQNGP